MPSAEINNDNYRKISLPHENEDTFYLTDSGLETQLIFKGGFELPDFATFSLLFDPRGVEYFQKYYRHHAAMAAKAASNDDSSLSVGFVFESVTWRASPYWLTKVGYSTDVQEIANKAIQLMAEMRDEFPELADKAILSGNIGPR